MGDSRDVRSPAFSLLSSRLGDMLLKLYKEDSPASKEFLYMGYELKAFHASYEVLRPYLQPSTYLISPIGSQLVRNIYDGVETICEELTGEIRVFSKQLEKARREHRKRAGYFFLLQGGNSFARDRNKRILKFFEGNKYVLERCQLRYGNMLLNLVLAVFAFSQFIRDAQEEAAFPDTSSYLINDLHTALDELRSRERKRKGNLSVKASWWWDGLPAQPPNVEPMPPLATLTRIWVNPEARLAAHPSPNDQAYQHIINQWREQNELQRDDIRRLAEENQRLETVNRDMTSDGVQLSRRIDELGEDKDNLQQTIDRLHGEIRRLVGEIETERTARHQQEQYTNYYRDQHERVQSQFNNLLTQKEVADRARDRARPGYNSVGRGFDNGAHEPDPSRRQTSTSRGTTHPRPQELPLRPSRVRSSSRQDQGPPTSYETQRHNRHRSSASNHTGRSPDGWSGTSTAVDNPGRHRSRDEYSRRPPPIPTQTRPYRMPD